MRSGRRLIAKASALSIVARRGAGMGGMQMKRSRGIVVDSERSLVIPKKKYGCMFCRVGI